MGLRLVDAAFGRRGVDPSLLAAPTRHQWLDRRAARHVGTFASEDVEVVAKADLDGSSLVLKRRPDTIRLTPLYADAFESQLGIIVFRREGGRVTAFSAVPRRL